MSSAGLIVSDMVKGLSKEVSKKVNQKKDRERAKSFLADKDDKKLEKTRSSSSASPPPSYNADYQADDLSGSIRTLKLAAKSVSVSSNTIPTTDECIAHLKLLTAFAQLREEISETDGLFGLHDALAERSERLTYTTSHTRTSMLATSRVSQLPAVAKIREKRWAVYVTRAVDRFQKWWETLLPGQGREVQLRMKDCITPHGLETMLKQSMPLRWRSEMLPPLDVLMVLHGFMLNPRNFLEDSFRYGMLSIWHAGFPWDIVNSSINDRTFDYSPPEEAVASFESKSGFAWDNLRDPDTRRIDCPYCHKSIRHVYTDGNMGIPDKAFEDGRGYADKSLQAECVSCGLSINRHTLGLQKFNQDVQRLLDDDVPMPGTILSINGTPESATTSDPSKHEVCFPNRLILAGLHTNLLDITRPDNQASRQAKVEDIRKAVEAALRDRLLISKANGKTFSKSIKRAEKIAVRRMMSKYWENSSPFALDLVGAVLRQGVFVEKMKSIDWIHSPALESTMSRLVVRYVNFFKIIEQNPGRMAVPTLDVDLAWHTHQLSPNAYFQYSLAHANGQFVDHDDKIDENVLSNSFEWTSRQYQKVTGGEVYSECTCWYCEAIREAHNQQSLFKSTAAKSHNAKALALHDRTDISRDPSKNAHISAHNAVKAESYATERIARHQAAKLEADYERAAKKAKKAGKDIPTRDAYAMGYVWGYPMYMPMGYYPFYADPCMSTGMYANNPGCMTTVVGAAGNCVSGACGGNVGAGGCAGAGGCGGGAAAGGCGGGGGGGGCGGGGGGGGCGGGGGA